MRKLCRTTRKVADDLILVLWNNLNKDLPKGGIDLKKLVTRVESIHDFKHKPLEAFKKLYQKITEQYEIKFPFSHVPLLPHHFTIMQEIHLQQKLDNNLVKIWPTLNTMIPKSRNIPSIESVNEMRELLKNPESFSAKAVLILNHKKLDFLPIEIASLTHLERLDINHNNLSELPDLSPLTLLKMLYLHNNMLRAFTGLNILANLHTLQMHNNQIENLPNLSTLIGLKQLYLGYNQLTTIFGLHALTQLQELYLDHNQLIGLSGLSNLTQLQYLNLCHNQLTNLPDLSPFPKLQFLDLSQNPWMFIHKNTLKQFETDPAIQQFNFQLRYEVETPFARLYQLIIRKSSEEKIKEAFGVLTDQDKAIIYEKLSCLSDIGIDDLRKKAFFSFIEMSTFHLAVQRAIFGKLEKLSPKDKMALYHSLHKLAGSPLTADLQQWGEERALQNIPRLVDALSLF